MIVNYYYSIKVLEAGMYDGEDGALHLCRDCARKHAEDVRWLSKGDDQSECEFCRASNDPANSAALDRIFAEVTNG
jgi:hypothetical protein